MNVAELTCYLVVLRDGSTLTVEADSHEMAEAVAALKLELERLPAGAVVVALPEP
jgi:hypothetical protein